MICNEVEQAVAIGRKPSLVHYIIQLINKEAFNLTNQKEANFEIENNVAGPKFCD